MDPTFVHSDRFLLRAALLPKESAGRLIRDDDPVAALLDSGEGDEDLGVLLEALRLSSPSLTSAVERLRSGVSMSPADEARVGRSLLRYGLRITGRPTPFGLLAGVAIGEVVEVHRTVNATLGELPRKRALPDSQWLGMRASTWEADPQVLAEARVITNNLCRRQGGRVVIPPTGAADPPRVRSIRRTELVAEAMERARQPVRYTDLVDGLTESYPALSHRQAGLLTQQLVALGVLLTNVQPAAEDPAPWRALARNRALTEDAHELEAAFAAYAETRVGQGTGVLRELHHLTESGTSVQTDVALDARLCLPKPVFDEISKAATALWHLFPTRGPRELALRSYHDEFLERYSIGETVPVARLLDPDTGLGPPAGYSWPAGHRVGSSGEEVDSARSALLHQLLVEAWTSGKHIDLTEAQVAQVGAPTGEPPASADVYARLIAPSVDDLSEGSFLVELSPVIGPYGGASWGRFTDLLGQADTLSDLLGTSHDNSDAPVPVQVFSAAADRSLSNVSRTPRVVPHQLRTGLFSDTEADGTLALSDIVISADTHGFRIHDLASGREIHPVAPHMTNRENLPNITRFLLEAPLTEVVPLRPWDWGAMADAPYLPSVRLGRVILSPARWRLTSSDLADGSLDDWIARWRVPSRIRLVHQDQHLALDLDASAHRDLLRRAVTPDSPAVVQEDLAPHTSWLQGPRGSHEAEIVVPIFRSARMPDRRRAVPLAPPRSAFSAHTPGGDWMSAEVHCSPSAQRHLLVDHLGPWLDALDPDQVDKWFFIRYRDHGTGREHLRIRVHGEGTTLNSHVLPAFRNHIEASRSAGLCGDFSLHPYRPEVERYGGPHCIALAEQVFHRDSRIALSKLHQDTDPILVAPDLVSMINAFHEGDQEATRTWVLSQIPKVETTHKLFVRHRREALSLITDSATQPVTELEREWRESLGVFGAAVREAAREQAWTDPDEVLAALLHMHCNRRLRPSAEREAEAYAVARGAVQAHADRSVAAARAR
ncbi:lantibiotic dehydratase [Streptomyces kunmingensis]|uniref:Lantibiotic dehydratase n=1 Tax=Streptomyces kunmingensis TaxID=68225 RepID=A0ABU6CE40_9ACTN|nr:lantibiotic dehydratase [Streptomyces kunmingensis]MEB3962984.1 lantibiotic dehydratase [Streptomyces kunmingensis]